MRIVLLSLNVTNNIAMTIHKLLLRMKIQNSKPFSDIVTSCNFKNFIILPE